MMAISAMHLATPNTSLFMVSISTALFQKTKEKQVMSTSGLAGLGGSVGCAFDWRPGGHQFDPSGGRQHSFVEIDHELFSTVILSLLLIQEWQLSAS